MANEQNLLRGNPDTQFRSGREAVEQGQKGGIASGVARRKKKTLRELASIMAAAPIESTATRKKLAKMGFEEEDMTNDALVTQALFNKALEGDVKAIEKWEELTSTEVDNTIEALHDLLDGIGTIE